MERKVYGSLNSPATLKVMACLFEHHLEFEFIPVDVEAEQHLHKSFLSMSPFGDLPVYEEGAIKHFESRAIIRSMSHQHHKRRKPGEELVCLDDRMQAIVSNWIDVEDHKFEPPALKLIDELTINKHRKRGLPNDNQAIVAEAKADLCKVLDIYENRLSKSKHLGHDKFTIADLLHLPNLEMLMGTSARELIESRPRVHAWCRDLLARPSWTKVLRMQQNLQG